MFTAGNKPETEVEAVVKRVRQGWLFPPPKPLSERLGREFFLKLPKTPGVYLMHGKAGRPRRYRVLYVGKSKNLRQRLGSYRHVHPDRDSRKTVRLVHSVESITFEQCGDETAALLRENELLRVHRPLFNRANVRPEAHGYIGLKAEQGRLTIKLAQEPEASMEWHGAFRGGRRHALASMLRLLAQRANGWSHWADIPRALCCDTAPRDFELAMTNARQTKRSLTSYLRGRSWKIVEQFEGWMRESPGRETFLENWRELDLELIRTFYLNGPRRNLRWRRKLGMSDDDVLRPEDLDDLPIKIRLPQEPCPWEAREENQNERFRSPMVDRSP